MTNASPPFFIQTEFERLAYRTVLDAGYALFHDTTALKKLSIVDSDIVALFKGKPDCTTVVAQKNGVVVQSACTCGFRFGCVCEHVIAAMLAANAEQSIQIGLDFRSPSSEEISSGEPSENHAASAGFCKDISPHEIEIVNEVPTPRLYLTERDHLLIVELRFSYQCGTVEICGNDRAREKLITGISGKIIKLHRPMVKEMDCATQLRESGLAAFSSGTYTPTGDQVLWIRSALPELSAKGYKVFGMESLVTFKPVTAKATMKLTTVAFDAGLIDCTISIDFEGRHASLGKVFEAVMAGKKYVQLTDGTTGLLPDEWIEKLTVIFALSEKKPAHDVVKLPKSNFAALSALEMLAGAEAWDSTRAQGMRQLERYEAIKKRIVPDSFKGTLRSYQQAGYDWFYFLQEFNINGCLADDMGLGKTVQTIALLLSEKARSVTCSPSLLLVPTTLLTNWQREMKSFGPTLLVMLYHGRDRKRFSIADMGLADVVITTYGTLQREIDLFKTITFNYIILDEAQAIKNPLSDSAKTVRLLGSRHRLALSGTPVENNLSELWSLFTFLNPGMLGSYKNFAATYVKPIEKDKCESRAGILRSMISPCILRRTKSQVAKELPLKTEMVIKVPMTPQQRILYDMTKDACRTSLLAAIDNKGIGEARLRIIQVLVRLRQICCHPFLVDRSYQGGSGKFDALNDLLENCVAENHKALVFSQFVSALDLLRKDLGSRGIRHEYLTGKTSDRQGVVDNFQEDDSVAVMLISLKAGGVGLNLTAADYVVMLDPWWNPAVENQAADRAYRIGQDKPVFVYKLIAEDSVEEKVLELQKSKRALFDAVIANDPLIFKSLTRDDIALLFE